MSSTDSGERLKVRGSISAKIGRAPARRIELAVAKKLKGLVMTPMPGFEGKLAEVLPPTPAAARASQSASVPLEHPIAKVEPQASAAAISNSPTFGPRIKTWESQTSAIAARISSRTGANWREKSSIGTDCRTGLDTEAMVQLLKLETFSGWSASKYTGGASRHEEEANKIRPVRWPHQKQSGCKSGVMVVL
jgi:hypothetical protein